jgi:hypothetical protein
VVFLAQFATGPGQWRCSASAQTGIQGWETPLCHLQRVSRIEPLQTLPERRRRRRQAFDVRAELRGAGGAVVPCRIVNLDATGAQVRLDGARLLPTDLALLLPTGPVAVTYSATILWRRGNLIGLGLSDRQELG